MFCDWFVKASVEAVFVNSVVGAVLSLIAEMWPWYGNLPKETKRWVMLALCMVVPVMALLLGVYWAGCEGMAITPDTLALAIATGSAAFGSSQAVHNKLRKKKSVGPLRLYRG